MLAGGVCVIMPSIAREDVELVDGSYDDVRGE